MDGSDQFPDILHLIALHVGADSVNDLLRRMRMIEVRRTDRDCGRTGKNHLDGILRRRPFR